MIISNEKKKKKKKSFIRSQEICVDCLASDFTIIPTLVIWFMWQCGMQIRTPIFTLLKRTEPTLFE